MREEENPYGCPKCGKDAPEFNGDYYEVDGKEYPIFQNEEKYFDGWYNMHDWEEVHHCCGEEYVIFNGAV